MEFKDAPIPADEQYTTHRWESGGPYVVVQLYYAYAQKRVQVWYVDPKFCYPDVLWTQF